MASQGGRTERSRTKANNQKSFKDVLNDGQKNVCEGDQN